MIHFYFYILLNFSLSINPRNVILLPLDSSCWDDSNELYFIFFWSLDQKLANCLIGDGIWQKCQSVINQLPDWWPISDWLMPNFSLFDLCDKNEIFGKKHHYQFFFQLVGEGGSRCLEYVSICKGCRHKLYNSTYYGLQLLGNVAIS